MTKGHVLAQAPSGSSPSSIYIFNILTSETTGRAKIMDTEQIEFFDVAEVGFIPQFHLSVLSSTTCKKKFLLLFMPVLVRVAMVRLT
jgi:hypothetical protein